MKELTLDSLKQIIPKNLRSSISEDMVENINSIIEDPEAAKLYREDLLTYTSVLKEGKFNFEAYLDACRFCTFKTIGDTNKDAYIKTFPDRYQRMVDNGWVEKDINSSISAYRKGMMVSKIMERSFIPISILARDLHLEALEVNHTLMYHASSDTVKQKASATILEYTKSPEEAKIEIDMSIRDQGNIVDQYENALRFAAQEQMKMIKAGGDIKNVANIKLTREEEIIDVQEDNSDEKKS